MIIAVLGLLAAWIIYLRPSLSPPATRSAPRVAASQQVGPPIFFDVSFGDADHGAVHVFSRVNQPNRPVPIYLTADGGHTWKPLAMSRNPILAVTFVGQR